MTGKDETGQKHAVGVHEILREKRPDILELWKKQLFTRGTALVESIGLDTLREKTELIVDQILLILPQDEGEGIESDAFEALKEILAEMSAELTTKDLSPSDTALLVFSLKDALLPVIQMEAPPTDLAGHLIHINSIIDKLGLYTFEVYLKTKEDLIAEQHRAFLEVSVPVVKIWNRILMIPLVGMLDSDRTMQMMEILLEAVEVNQSKVAILDISGIPVVDTLVARHLITTASAVQLMGAECIITGIRAKISQTLVQLGVDLTGIITRTTLADGLAHALELTEQQIAMR